MSQLTQYVAGGLILAAGVVAVAATAIVLTLERRRSRREPEDLTRAGAPPPPAGHHLRVEIDGTVFEVRSTDPLTRDEIAGMVETAMAAEDRRRQQPEPDSGA